MQSHQSHFHSYSSLSSYIGTGITELELSSLYRCLDYLYANKESILAHINRKVEGLYPRQNSLLFYDTTNCYFETSLDDEQTFTRYAKQDFCELLRDEGYEVAPDEVAALLEKEPSKENHKISKTEHLSPFKTGFGIDVRMGFYF